MATGFSGFGKSKNASYPIELTMRASNKSITTQSKVILEGIRANGMYISVDNALIPLLNYLDISKWFVAASLNVGNNAVAIKAYDNIYHRYSDGVSINVTRNAINTSQQYKNYKVLVNGVDYTNNITDLNVDTSDDLTVDKAELTLHGNYMSDVNFEHYNDVIISIDDGFLGSLEEVFRGKIENKSFDFRNAEKTTKITALHKILNALDTTNSLFVTGAYNGDVMTELFNTLGITDLWVFNRYKYSGKRYLNDIKPLDVIKDIAAVQGEIVSFDKNNQVNMIPDEYLNYPLFEFTEDEVLELSIEESNDTLFNKINVVYGEPDEKEKSGGINVSLIQDPTTDIGYGFYVDEYLKTPLTKLPKFGTVYFAVWDKITINWDFIVDARLKLVHFNDTLNISGDIKEYVLEVIDSKKIAITEILMDNINVTVDSNLKFTVRLEDTDKKVYNPNISMDIQDTLLDISNQINAFNALFTQVTEVADVDVILNITDNDPNNELSERNTNIVYVTKQSDKSNRKNNENQDVKAEATNYYEFLYRIQVDECLLSTLQFNLVDSNTIYAYLDDVEIVQDENNRELFGKKYVRAVTYSNPRTAYNRIKYVYILFKTISNPKTISFKFKLYGRKFIDTGNYIDYDNLNAEATNAISVAKYGVIDGRYLISNYISNVKQTENLAEKLVAIYGYPVVSVKLKLPLISELRKNIMIKVTSTNSGINNYYYIHSVNKNFDGCEADCYLLRTTTLKRDQGVESEYDIYTRNMENIVLSPFMNALMDRNKGIEKGIVLTAHQDNTATVKIFGTNSKYTRINVLQGLNVKKNDKVLCALAADNTRIIIAILEKYVDNIEYEEPNDLDEVFVEPETDLGDGFSSGDKETDADNLTVDISTAILNLWKFEPNTDILTPYTAVPADANVIIATSAPVEVGDLANRILIIPKDPDAETLSCNMEAINIGKTATYIIDGQRITKTPCNGLILQNIDWELEQTYKVRVQAGIGWPLISIDGYYKITKDIDFEIKIEPEFKAIGVRVLNPNAYEVILSHPLAKDFVLTNQMYLIEQVIEEA